MTDDDLRDVLAAAHHAYCRDTGCFDGDDISLPKNALILAAIRARDRRLRDEGAVAALEGVDCRRWRDPEYTCLARLDRGESLLGNERCDRCAALAAARARLAQEAHDD